VTSREYLTAVNYAKILLKIYCPTCGSIEQEQNNPRHYAILKALKKVNNFLKDKHNYYALSLFSRLPVAKSDQLLQKIAEVLSLDVEFLLFLRFVVRNKKVRLFPCITQVATDMICEKVGTQVCNIFASHPLPQACLTAVQNYFSQKLGKRLDVNFAVKKDLLLGIQVITKQYIWEVSFAQKLQQIVLGLKLGMNYEK